MRLSGFGGQGIILAGQILARAAVECEGIFAAQSQSYGAASRGGATAADIVLSAQKIDFPEPEDLHVLVAMSQSALDRHIHALLPSGTLITDSDLVTRVPQGLEGHTYRIPATRIARDKLGSELIANLVMLGALVRLTGLVSIDALTTATERSVPRQTFQLNRHAIEAGVKIAEELIS